MKKLRRKAKEAAGNNGPLWVMERDGVTQGLLYTFLLCREQCRLKFVEGLRSRVVSRPLEFGNLVHYVLSHCYMGDTRPRQRMIEEGIQKHNALWRKVTGAVSAKQEEEREFIEGLARVVLPAYFHHWEEDFKNKKWVHLEQAFSVPYVYEDGFEVPLRGRRDGIYELEGGGEGLFETKTKGYIDEDGIAEILPFDMQVGLYVLSRGLETGVYPTEVCYNIIRRPGQRLTKKDGDLSGLLARIEEDVWERPAYYFLRLQMDITEEEFTAWKDRIFHPVMEELRAWCEGRLPTYINPYALITNYGRCDLFEAVAHGNKKAYNVVKVPFTELLELEDG